jgi:hypothetical protein
VTKQAGTLIERLRQVGPAPEDAAVPVGSFMRGLALGALVGAAIAGSTIWNRRQHRRRPVDVKATAPPDPGSPSAP